MRFKLKHTTNWHQLTLLGIFMISGGAGLIYEVVWVRQLTTVLGASSYAVAIVLAAFMSGLGLGSWLLGKKSDQLNAGGLSKVYIILEMGVAVYALFFPRFLAWAERGYVLFYQNISPDPLSFQAFKLGLAFLLLVFPTTLMGATLPVLCCYLVRRKETVAVQISWLYAANTFGAILGTLAAGYSLLPNLGMHLTTLVAVGLNLFAALGLFCFRMLISEHSVPEEEAAPLITREKSDTGMSVFQWSVVIGFGLSGAAAMFYQVAWTRTLSMVLGTTTFAFTTMLATFLIGIALGSLSYKLCPVRLSKHKLFIGFQLLAGFSALLTIPLFEKLPLLYLSLHDNWVSSWQGMQGLRFALAALIMLVPTFSLGAMFPIISALLIDNIDQLGRRVGKAYALNTLGAVLGAAIAGLVLIPLIGMQQTIILGALLNLLAGLAVCWAHRETKLTGRLVFAGGTIAMALVGVLAIQPWSPRIINSGVYLYASRYQNMEERFHDAWSQAQQAEGGDNLSTWDIYEMAMRQYDLLYYKPGLTATVAVMQRNDGVRFLTIDGKTDASTGKKSDMRTQVMIGQLPLLFHKDPDKALVVGLGSGVTASSVLSHKVRLVNVAEISPGVIEASHLFSEANNRALDDPRLRIIPRDARNLLLTEDEHYDVVISQPSNPWIKGEASLFTEEWYHLVKQRLNKDGLFVQWVPSYLMAEHDIKVITHTLHSVFPHLTVWKSGSVGDLIFLASKGSPLQIDFRKFLARVSDENVAQDLARVDATPRELFLEQFVMGENDLVPYLYTDQNKALRKNTDDWTTIEFSTPKQLLKPQSISQINAPVPLRTDPATLLNIISENSLPDFSNFLGRVLEMKNRETKSAKSIPMGDLT